MARAMLRHIRVASKAELKARILAYLDDLNRNLSSIPGPIKSTRRLDTSRSTESLDPRHGVGARDQNDFAGE